MKTPHFPQPLIVKYYSIPYLYGSQFGKNEDFLYKVIKCGKEEDLYRWSPRLNRWLNCGGSLKHLKTREIKPEEVALMVGVL